MTQPSPGATLRGTADTLTLPLCTLMHFAVDGVCAATLAVYALNVIDANVFAFMMLTIFY